MRLRDNIESNSCSDVWRAYIWSPKLHWPPASSLWRAKFLESEHCSPFRVLFPHLCRWTICNIFLKRFRILSWSPKSANRSGSTASPKRIQESTILTSLYRLTQHIQWPWFRFILTPLMNVNSFPSTNYPFDTISSNSPDTSSLPNFPRHAKSFSTADIIVLHANLTEEYSANPTNPNIAALDKVIKNQICGSKAKVVPQMAAITSTQLAAMPPYTTTVRADDRMRPIP